MAAAPSFCFAGHSSSSLHFVHFGPSSRPASLLINGAPHGLLRCLASPRHDTGISPSRSPNSTLPLNIKQPLSPSPTTEEDSCIADQPLPSEEKRHQTDIQTIFARFWKVAAPYWSSEDKFQARLRLGGVFALTLATTGISVGFNFLGRDFYNALASKDQEQFTKQLLYYLGAFIGGIPVFVLRDYARDTLSLRWRAWMTNYYLDRYFKNRTFYQIQSQSLIDNPDQRIVDDLNSFTGTALSFSLALFNATIDLISFSGILFGIYPPLFLVLVIYSIGGTAISIALGKDLVNLNFLQEKKEADFRYGLVRVRENAESIAFYSGEKNEVQLLLDRFKLSFENFSQLLIASRNLEFFTNGYRYVIQVLPAAVVAPMYFSGKIEFGVINQSYSAFNHILSDFSIIVYQFQALSAFSAVIDRLGEFNDLLDQQNVEATVNGRPVIEVTDAQTLQDCSSVSDCFLLKLENLTLQTPQYSMTLIEGLTLTVRKGENLLVMGASGSGKTSLLRAIAGLWRSGTGKITRRIHPSSTENNGAAFESDKGDSAVETNLHDRLEVEKLADTSDKTEAVLGSGKGSTIDSLKEGRIFFLPQRPYMVLGTLRQQLLYPTWRDDTKMDAPANKDDSSALLQRDIQDSSGLRESPSDEMLIQALRVVNLSNLLDRCKGLDSQVEWSSVLSLGEQQRLAFARLLLAQPVLALLDESTSALDEENEAHLYQQIHKSGITYVSVGHRRSLRGFHSFLLTLHSPKQDSKNQNWTLKQLTD